MDEDDVIREIRATREAFAARHNYDLRSMVAELQSRDAAGDRIVVALEPRRVPSTVVPANIGTVASQVATLPTAAQS